MKKLHFCFVIVTIALLSCHPGTVKEKEMLAAQDWFQKGVEFERQDVQEGAIKMYTEAIALNRNYAEAYFRRGRAYMAAHKTNTMEALGDFNRAIDIDPANAEAYYERGLVHLFIINNENALDDMRTAARLGHEGARKWLAAEQERGKIKEALEALKEESLKAETDSGRAGAQKQPAVESSEKGKEKQSKHSNFGQYLSPGSEPVIYFDHNRSGIKGQYRAVLDEIADVLKEKIPETNVVLAGHADSTGAEAYNDKLSLRRARAVEAYLKKHGVPSERMTVKGFGQKAPLDTNETEEGQAKNRRVEILEAGN